jgi:hypothetical protein
MREAVTLEEVASLPDILEVIPPIRGITLAFWPPLLLIG